MVKLTKWRTTLLTKKSTNVLGTVALLSTLVTLMTACSPKFDWREVRGDAAGDLVPYTVLMPDKPSRRTRRILLGQQTVSMHMSYAEIDKIKFAVGAINMPDATQAQTAIAQIKTALLANINGRVIDEKSSVTNEHGKLVFNLDLQAVGSAPASSNVTPQTTRLAGRIVTRDTWVFQVVVIGPQPNIDQDSVDTFLASFTLGID